MITKEELVAAIDEHRNPEKAVFLQRFFKTGKGEYAEGDVLLGVVVPTLRKIAKRFKSLPLSVAEELLQSPVHEHRFVALLFFVEIFQKGDEFQKKSVVDTYLRNTQQVNNWDLVDLSAHKILGAWLSERSHDILFSLAKSTLLWERRIAVISTFHFIRVQRRFDTLLRIAEMLLDDPEDLVHKATGWMLREVGARDSSLLRAFLDAHAPRMPRVMLRYAIEKMEATLRRDYLGRAAKPISRP